MATNTPIENIFELYNLYDLKINAATIKEALDSSVDDKTGNISLFNLYTALNNLIENTIQPDINTLKTAKADKTTVDTLQTELNNAKSIIPKRYIVDTLPEEDIDLNGVYYVPSQESDANMYTEKVYINGKWETIGEPYEIYLKDYYSKKELDTLYYYGDSSIVPTDSGYFTYTVDDSGNVTITKYTGSDTDIVIPYEIDGHKVTQIGDGAFTDNTVLISVTIPNSVIGIGTGAFSGCSNLTNIAISNSVTYMGGNVFSGCSSLTHVTIPDSITYINLFTFEDCSNLTSVTIPNSVTKIYYGAFENCKNLTDIIISKNVTKIDDVVFSGCSNLTNVIISDSVTRIGDEVFGGCSSLTHVAIPDSVTRIGDAVFSGCSNLASVIISDSVTKIGDETFAGCSNLTSVIIPDRVSKIGDRVFSGCSKLTSVTIPDSVTKIGDGAFDGCSGIKDGSLTIYCSKGSYAETYVQQQNFQYEYYGNASIDHVHQNKNTLNGITDEKVAEWDKITTLETQVSDIDIEAERLKYYNDPDIVPSNENYFTVNETGETITGLTDTGKTQTELVIPYKINGVEIRCIGRGAFSYCTSLKSINIPNNVTSIEDSTFSGCTSLTSINIPNNVTSIGYSTFSGCTSLTSINIPDSVTSIGGGVFAGCTSLTDVKISKGLKSINIATFETCTSLTSINIPSSVTSIYGNSYNTGSFAGCTNLTIYCEQGSYAETYAKEENIPVVYTDVKPTSINPIVKTAIDEIMSINTIYDLGVQTELTMTLPSGQVGNFIEVDFISGETATTLTVNSSSGLIGFDLIPGTNTIYTLYFEWGATGYDETSVTYGWRFNYSEYSMDV